MLVLVEHRLLDRCRNPRTIHQKKEEKDLVFKVTRIDQNMGMANTGVGQTPLGSVATRSTASMATKVMKMEVTPGIEEVPGDMEIIAQVEEAIAGMVNKETKLEESKVDPLVRLVIAAQEVSTEHILDMILAPIGEVRTEIMVLVVMAAVAAVVIANRVLKKDITKATLGAGMEATTTTGTLMSQATPMADKVEKSSTENFSTGSEAILSTKAQDI